MQTQISQLNNEREELLGKIEAGDGAANTAIQQLKLQNVRMLDAIWYYAANFIDGCYTKTPSISSSITFFQDALTKQIQSQNEDKKEIFEENKRQLEELHTILNETKTSLTSSNDKSKKLETEKDNLTNKLSGLAHEKAKVENDLIEKVWIFQYLMQSLVIMTLISICVFKHEQSSNSFFRNNWLKPIKQKAKKEWERCKQISKN